MSIAVGRTTKRRHLSPMYHDEQDQDAQRASGHEEPFWHPGLQLQPTAVPRGCAGAAHPGLRPLLRAS